MPRNQTKPDPWYAIIERKGPWGTTYRVSFTRHGKNVAKLFRDADYGSPRAALKAARTWRDKQARRLLPQTKQEFSRKLRPDNTSGCAGVYLKQSVRRIGGRTYEYTYWQAWTPEGVKPFRSRSFSIERYGYDVAYALAVRARDEFVAEVEGYIGVGRLSRKFWLAP
jgi:hypothetical protein